MNERHSPNNLQYRARLETLSALNHISDEGWRVSGVSLYLVVSPDMTLASDRPGTSRFWAQPRELSDRLLYQIAEPAVLKNGQTVQPEYPLHDVPHLFVDMFDDACARQPQLHADDVQYVIAHIRELHGPPITNQEQQQWISEPWKREKVARVVTVYLRGVLDLFDSARIGTPRGYFDHYDYITRKTGHIAFGRTATVLGGLSDTQLRTFVTQLSGGEMAHGGGLSLDTFVPVLTLVGQWNGNQDVRANVDLAQESMTLAQQTATEVQDNVALTQNAVDRVERNVALTQNAVDRVEQNVALTQNAIERVQQNVALSEKTVEQVSALRISGDYALTGTIWISYALAAIGVITALLNYMKDPILVLPGSLLLGASCVCNAGFATTGNKVVRFIAQFLFWVGLVVAAAGGGANLIHLPLPSFLPGKTS